MEEKNLKISIAHLYPKLLNLYGDMGNIITLKNVANGVELTLNLKKSMLAIESKTTIYILLAEVRINNKKK